jgi:hypothetical protein
MKRLIAVTTLLIGALIGANAAVAGNITYVGFDGFVLGAERTGDR